MIGASSLAASVDFKLTTKLLSFLAAAFIGILLVALSSRAAF